jgi:hypothetical protein
VTLTIHCMLCVLMTLRLCVFMLKVLQENLTEEQKALLAAGPVEDLLALHGAKFIDHVEVAGMYLI